MKNDKTFQQNFVIVTFMSFVALPTDRHISAQMLIEQTNHHKKKSDLLQPDRPMDEKFIEGMLINEYCAQKKIRPPS